MEWLFYKQFSHVSNCCKMLTKLPAEMTFFMFGLKCFQSSAFSVMCMEPTGWFMWVEINPAYK